MDLEGVYIIVLFVTVRNINKKNSIVKFELVAASWPVFADDCLPSHCHRAVSYKAFVYGTPVPTNRFCLAMSRCSTIPISREITVNRRL